jgi:quercetin dioxygenase-like cupin family protein
MELVGYELSLKERADFQERQRTGRIVVKGSDQEWESGRQGTVRRYLQCRGQIDTPLHEWSVFIHDIKTHSGRHRHQGGLVIFVLEGEGATEVDGEALPWQAGDLILLPIKPKGVEHKHINRNPGQSCKWMAFIYQPLWNHVASEMVQLELSAEFSQKVGGDASFIQAQAENTSGSKIFLGDDPAKIYGERLAGATPMSLKTNGGASYYEQLMQIRNQQRQTRRSARWIIHEKDLPWENNPQGLMRWYMHPSMEDIVIQTYLFIMQEIPPGSRSGKQLYQGGQVIFFLEGRGYTVMDGVKHPWEAGDLIQLPLRRDGVIYQHFNNDSSKRVRFVACEPNHVFSTGVDRGSGFEQIEPSPEYGTNYQPEG